MGRAAPVRKFKRHRGKVVLVSKPKQIVAERSLLEQHVHAEHKREAATAKLAKSRTVPLEARCPMLARHLMCERANTEAVAAPGATCERLVLNREDKNVDIASLAAKLRSLTREDRRSLLQS